MLNWKIERKKDVKFIMAGEIFVMEMPDKLTTPGQFNLTTCAGPK